MEKRSSRFGKYSSKVKRVNIPIPSFEYVHKSLVPDRSRKTTPGLMIGRDRIIEKLKYWLNQDTLSSGSYLITGYRGMGKTCFVERVLYELVAEPKFWVNVSGIVVLIVFGISLSSIINPIYDCISSNLSSDSSSPFLKKVGDNILAICGIILPIIYISLIRRHYRLKEWGKKSLYRVDAGIRMAKRKGCRGNLSDIPLPM